MNLELTKKLAAFATSHQWTDFLRALPLDEPLPVLCDSVQEMNTLRTVASRMNKSDERRYSFSGIDYENKVMVVTVKSIEKQ